LSRTKATLVGFTAIGLWSMLAFLTVRAGAIPPFQLTAMVFAVGGLLGLAVYGRKPGFIAGLRQGWPVWALGLGGLFGYHAVYFLALRLAPAAEASLVAYLWPLLIVVFSALLPGESLKRHHVIGVGIGFLGLLVLAFGRGELAFKAEHLPGYVCALASALIWSAYSVLSRRFKQVPTQTVTGFVLVSAVLSLLCHLLFEDTVMPQGTGQWVAILLLGLGPMGIAFLTWDIGMKQGDIRALGAASYATPVLSTLVLVTGDLAAPSWPLFAAALLIAGGGLYAAQDMFRRRNPAPTPSAPA
jgi:drug/metabolite transporter (DMT)-like permease